MQHIWFFFFNFISKKSIVEKVEGHFYPIAPQQNQNRMTKNKNNNKKRVWDNFLIINAIILFVCSSRRKFNATLFCFCVSLRCCCCFILFIVCIHFCIIDGVCVCCNINANCRQIFSISYVIWSVWLNSAIACKFYLFFIYDTLKTDFDG